jgi:hypothetical protein
VVVLSTIKIVPQGREFTVEHFGRYVRTLKPGINILTPFVETIAKAMTPGAENQVSFSEIRIQDGELNYEDGTNSISEQLGDIDLSLAWRSCPTPQGKFGLSMDGTYLTKYHYQREKGGNFISSLGRYSDNAPVFRWQHVMVGTWAMGPWTASLAQRYKSGYLDQDGANQVGAYSVVDLGVTWSGIKGLTLAAGINNLLDKDPPVTGQTTTFQRGFDPRFTDPIGRSFNFRASYKFF